MGERLDVFIDFDTSIIEACSICQDNYSIYKDDKFIGQASSMKKWKEAKLAEWIALNPDIDVEEYKEDNWDYREEARLKVLDEEQTESDFKIEYRAMKAIKDKKIQKEETCLALIHEAFPEIYDNIHFWYVIEGEGNFREDLYPDYKGNRTVDIILKDKIKIYTKRVTPNLIIAEGCETDDIVSMQLLKGYLDFKKTGVYTTAVDFTDKDIKNTAGFHLHSADVKKDGKGDIIKKGSYHLQTPDEAIRHFLFQMLKGDSTDNIKGLNGSPSEAWWVRQKERIEGLRKSSKGIGDVTAAKVISACETPQEAFQEVVEAYKEVHGDSFKEALNEEAIALWMMRFKGQRYSFTDHCEKLGVVL